MKKTFFTKKTLSVMMIVLSGMMISGSYKNGKLASLIPSKIYVANEEGSSVSVIDLDDNLKTKTINIKDSSGNMFMAHNVQVAPDGKSVWLTAVPMDKNGMNQVLVINPDTDTIKKRINLGKDLHVAHVVLDSESKYAFITANESSEIIEVNAATYQVIKRFKLGKGYLPHGMRYSNGKLYVANMGAKSLSVINISSGKIAEIPLKGVVVQTAVTQDGKFILASLYDTKEVVRYDLQNGQIKRIKLPADSQGPIQLYATHNSKLLYVADQGELMKRAVSNKVFVIDISAAKVIKTITVGKKAHGVVVSKDGKTVYVTNSSDNTVSIIDVATQKVTNTLSVGKGPNGISYWFKNGGMP